MFSVRDAARYLDPLRPANRLRGIENPAIEEALGQYELPAWDEEEGLNNSVIKTWVKSEAVREVLRQLPIAPKVGLAHRENKGLYQLHRFASGQVRSLREIAERHEKGIKRKFIWYNTFLLNSAVHNKPELEKRRVEIGRALAEAGYHVAALCEVFDESERKPILQAVSEKFPGTVGSKGPDPSYLESSGLYTIVRPELSIMNKAPNPLNGRMIYGEHHDYEDSGRDATDVEGLTAKGILYLDIDLAPRLPGRMRIDLFTTHMHASSPEVRYNQLGELISFIRRKQKPANVTVVAGDFNMRFRDGNLANSGLPIPEYAWLVTKMASLDLYDVALTHGGLAGSTHMVYDYRKTCAFDLPNADGYYLCDDYPKVFLKGGDDVPGYRLDYIFIEMPKEKHSFNLDHSRLRRRPFWRHAERFTHPLSRVERRYFRDVFFEMQPHRDEPHPLVDGLMNYMSDHLGLEIELVASSK